MAPFTPWSSSSKPRRPQQHRHSKQLRVVPRVTRQRWQCLWTVASAARHPRDSVHQIPSTRHKCTEISINCSRIWCLLSRWDLNWVTEWVKVAFNVSRLTPAHREKLSPVTFSMNETLDRDEFYLWYRGLVDRQKSTFSLIFVII